MSVDYKIRLINTGFYAGLIEIDPTDYREQFFWRFQSVFGREPTSEEGEIGWNDILNADVVVTFREGYSGEETGLWDDADRSVQD